MKKSLIIVIDEFSSRVLNYSNTTLYEYGDVTAYYAERFWTSETFHKYEEVGKTEDIFYEVTPDNEHFDNKYLFDLDSFPTSMDNGLGVSYQILEFEPEWLFGQTDVDLVNHGDWTVEAIQQTLEKPEATDILLFDVDSLASDQYPKLFEQLNFCVAEFLLRNDSRSNPNASVEYDAICLSISVAGGLPTTRELDVIEFLENIKAPIFQSAVNSTKIGQYNWAFDKPDIIVVGAYNEDLDGNLRASNVSNSQTVDLFADGYIAKPEWGATFGTSFATPRAAAAYANFANETFESGGNLNDLLGKDYPDLVNSVLDAISTPVNSLIEVDGSLWSQSSRLLSMDVAKHGHLPTILDLNPFNTFEVIIIEINGTTYFDQQYLDEMLALAYTSSLTSSDGVLHSSIDSAITSNDELVASAATVAALTSAAGTQYASVDAAFEVGLATGVSGVDLTIDNDQSILEAFRQAASEVGVLDVYSFGKSELITAIQVSNDGQIIIEDTTPFSQADMDAMAAAATVAASDAATVAALTTYDGNTYASVDAAITSNDALIELTTLTTSGGTVFQDVDAAVVSNDLEVSGYSKTEALTASDGTIYANVDYAIAAGINSVDVTSNDEAVRIAALTTSDGTVYNHIDDAIPTNSAPSGDVILVGASNVGSELSADFSGVTDADGIVNFTKIEWLLDKVALSDDGRGVTTNVNSNTFLIAETELGGKLSVRITYEDGLGNIETINSAEVTVSAGSFLQPLIDSSIANSGNGVIELDASG
ncbi:hypothetical protein N9L81_05795, partial [Planktomarina temperata]|nr:hypothetical protein [Planktomarina temperata]